MYQFYYNVLKKKNYGSGIRLLETDTNSLIDHIETDDIYEDIKRNIHYYDISNYRTKLIKKFLDYSKTNI